MGTAINSYSVLCSMNLLQETPLMVDLILYNQTVIDTKVVFEIWGCEFLVYGNGASVELGNFYRKNNFFPKMGVFSEIW